MSSDADLELGVLSSLNPVDVRCAAMNLLARREHTQSELQQKLLKRFDDHALIEQEVAKLTQENLQSDARFAQSFLRQRVGRGYGPLRIRQEMRQRGLNDDQIRAAFSEEVIDWFECALLAYQKKYGSTPVDEFKERARRMRFLQYRGFSHEHIDAVL